MLRPANNAKPPSPSPSPSPTTALCNNAASAVSRWLADGNANDSIGGNNGALQFGATLGPGVSGQAFSLDGLENYFLD